MNQDELARIIVKKQKKIDSLKALLLAHNLVDEIEKLEWLKRAIPCGLDLSSVSQLMK